MASSGSLVSRRFPPIRHSTSAPSSSLRPRHRWLAAIIIGSSAGARPCWRTKPRFRPDCRPPTWPLSTRTTERPRRASSCADDSPSTPPPTTTTSQRCGRPAERAAGPGRALVMSGVKKSVASVTDWALWPRYLGRVPVLANRDGASQPRAEFGLRELRVAVLEPDAVGVALAQVCDQHLARVLVLPALGNLKMDLEKGVGVPVEDRRDAILVHQVDILQPVEVLARGRRDEVNVVYQGPVELIGEGPPGQFLGVDADLHRQVRRRPELAAGRPGERFLSHCADRPCPRSVSAFPVVP